MSNTAPGNIKTPLLLTGVTAVMCLSFLLFIYSTSENTLKRYVPWVDAAMEIKLEVTLAHLWFEEVLSGDPSHTIQTVEKHIDNAKWYSTAILDGGSNEQGTFQPLMEEGLRQQVNQLHYQLEQLQGYTDRRYRSSLFNAAGSKVDREYDKHFHGLLSLIDQLEKNLKQHISNERTAQNSLMLMLMMAIFAMTGVAIFSIWRFTLNRNNYLLQLSAANQRIVEQNAQLTELAHTDQLTGLPNRKMLETIAGQIIGRVHRGKAHMSLTFIDVDFFKPINDQYGHSVGDKVLTGLTRTVSAQLREGDVLARLAGDEFILLVQEESEDALHVALDQIFSRINKELLNPIVTEPVEIHIRISAGTAVAPTHADSFEELLHVADLAMYYSKKQGRGQHYYYMPEKLSPPNSELITPELEAATE